MIKQWISSLEENKQEIVKLLLTQLNSAHDLAVMFIIIESLNMLIKGDIDCNFDYQVLLQASTETIAHLLTHLTSPNHLWQISHFIGNLLQNCGDQINFQILASLDSLNLEEIIKKNPSIMKSIFAQMLGNILVSSPVPNFIYGLSFQFLQISLFKLDSEDVELVLKFWLKFIRQVDANRSEEDQQMLRQLFKLFDAELKNLMLKMDSEENVSGFMQLIEELILANYDFKDFNNFLGQLYVACHKENRSSSIRLKNDFFSIITSYLLFMQSLNQVQAVPLGELLKITFSEMNENISENPQRSEMNLRNQVTAIFGRIVLINFEGVANFLQQSNTDLGEFILLLDVIFLIFVIFWRK